jgi:hypothetical protein
MSLPCGSETAFNPHPDFLLPSLPSAEALRRSLRERLGRTEATLTVAWALALLLVAALATF